MNYQTKEDLEALQKLFAEPGRWCQKALARRQDEQPCEASDSQATSWCIVGGIEYVTNIDPDRANNLKIAIRAVLPMMQCTITGWNDTFGRGREEVVKLLQQAHNLLCT